MAYQVVRLLNSLSHTYRDLILHVHDKIPSRASFHEERYLKNINELFLGLNAVHFVLLQGKLNFTKSHL